MCVFSHGFFCQFEIQNKQLHLLTEVQLFLLCYFQMYGILIQYFCRSYSIRIGYYKTMSIISCVIRYSLISNLLYIYIDSNLYLLIPYPQFVTLLPSPLGNHKVAFHTCVCFHFAYKFICFIFWIPLLLLLLLSRFSRVRLCATPEMAAHQAPPSLGFSRQEHWSGIANSICLLNYCHSLRSLCQWELVFKICNV